MFSIWLDRLMNELVVIKTSNVVPLYPNGVPKKVADRLSSVKSPDTVRADNVFSGFQSNISLSEERQFLHNTLDGTLGSLYSMSPKEKHDTFVGLANSMKMIFDLYMKEKCK